MSDPIITLTDHTQNLVELLRSASDFLARGSSAYTPVVQQKRATIAAVCDATPIIIAAALDEYEALRAQIRRDGALLEDLSHLSIGQTPPSVLLDAIKASAQAALDARRLLIGEEAH